MSDKGGADKTKYIPPKGLDRLIPVDSLGEGGSIDKALDFIATRIGKSGDAEGETFLKALGAVVGVPERILKGVVQLPQLLAYPAFALEYARGLVDKSIAEGKIKKADREKAIAQEKTRIDEITKKNKELAEFNRNSENTSILLDGQSEMVGDLLEGGQPGDLDFLRSQNLLGWLHIDPDKLENAETFKAAIEQRRNATELINQLLASPKIRKTDENTFLSHLYSYLTAPNATSLIFNEDEIAEIKRILGEDFSDLRRLALREDIKNILQEIKSGKTLDQVKAVLTQIPDIAERLATNPEALRNYKEAWITGAAYTILPFSESTGLTLNTPNDVLNDFREAGVKGDYNPFFYLGFVNVPSSDEIEDKVNDLTSIQTRVPSAEQMEQDITIVRKTFSQQEIQRNSDLILNLSRKDVEALDVLTKIFIQLVDPMASSLTVNYDGERLDLPLKGGSPQIEELIKIIKETIFPEKKSTAVSAVDTMLLRQDKLKDLLENLELQTNPALKPLLDVLKQLDSVSLINRSLIFGNEDESDSKSTLNFIKAFNVPNQMFDILYHHYDGNLNYIPWEKKKSLPKRLYSDIIGGLANKRVAALQLLEISKDDTAYGKAKEAHMKHLLKIINGEVGILENVGAERDPQKFIDDLSAFAYKLQDNFLFKKKYPRLAELNKEIPIDLEGIVAPQLPRNEHIEDTATYPEIIRLKNSLNSVARILYTRYAEILSAFGDSSEIPEDLQDELIMIQNYRNMLSSLGFDLNNILGDNNFSDKILRMYLNGLIIDPGAFSRKTIKNCVGKSSYCLKKTKTKVKL